MNADVTLQKYQEADWPFLVSLRRDTKRRHFVNSGVAVNQREQYRARELKVCREGNPWALAQMRPAAIKSPGSGVQRTAACQTPLTTPRFTAQESTRQFERDARRHSPELVAPQEDKSCGAITKRERGRSGPREPPSAAPRGGKDRRETRF